MGKGRSPCCDKSKVKRGPWSPSEDLKLITFIQSHGHENWRALPAQAGLLRCGKSCRLRWINYLRPDLKRGNMSPEEEEMIIKLHKTYGNKWSKIASFLPGRTDNEIKNIWNTHIIKKLGIKCVRSRTVKRKNPCDSTESLTKTLESDDYETDQYSKTSMSPSDIKVQERETQGFEAIPRKDEDEDEDEHEHEHEEGESPTPSSISCLSNVLASKEHDYGQMDIDFSASLESRSVSDSKAVDEPIFQTMHDFDELDFWSTLELDSLCPVQCVDNEVKTSKACEGSASDGFGTKEPDTGNVEPYSWVRFLEIELGLDA
ncbi:hypothetical protein V2J09_001237 [Rumex salicifolius]